MSAYSYVAYTSGLSHKELLSTIWGFDISPFAAELAVINLYRQDMSEFENSRMHCGTSSIECQGKLWNSQLHDSLPEIEKFQFQFRILTVSETHHICDLRIKTISIPFTDTNYLGLRCGQGLLHQPNLIFFAFFIYHALHFMKVGSRLGFVTPASWLTADYARALQELLLGSVRVVAVVASSAESSLPQVDINAVLLVAEKIKDKHSNDPIRFVTLKRPLARLMEGKGEYWARVAKLVDQFEAAVG